jgi:hypothetical protein
VLFFCSIFACFQLGLGLAHGVRPRRPLRVRVRVNALRLGLGLGLGLMH